MKRYLGWLDQENLISRRSGAVPLDDALLEAYVGYLFSRVAQTTAHHSVVNLERALSVLGPDRHRAMLLRAANNLRVKPDLEAKLRRVRDPGDLIELGFELMAAAAAGLDLRMAVNSTLFRDGLLIAALAHLALRRGNFLLEIGSDFRRMGRSWAIDLPASRTKAGKPQLHGWPTELQAPLEAYLEYWRPMLVDPQRPTDRLWLTYRGRPMTGPTLYLAVVRRTFKKFGESINPHFFRFCRAMEIATTDPLNIEKIAILLGNTYAVVQASYLVTDATSAAQSLCELLDEEF